MKQFYQDVATDKWVNEKEDGGKMGLLNKFIKINRILTKTFKRTK